MNFSYFLKMIDEFVFHSGLESSVLLKKGSIDFFPQTSNSGTKAVKTFLESSSFGPETIFFCVVILNESQQNITQWAKTQKKWRKQSFLESYIVQKMLILALVLNYKFFHIFAHCVLHNTQLKKNEEGELTSKRKWFQIK